MNSSIEMPGMRGQWRKWGVFIAVSAMFFFLNMATFTSLGVVLFTMIAQLHWSLTAAGFSFTVLGVACGVSSPFAGMAMQRLGSRFTICLGACMLLLGFLLAAISHSMAVFYCAMILLGTGYSFGGNVPGVALIAAWFDRGSARVIGIYLMMGAFGAACGPPLVHFLVNEAGGWRGHWRLMAGVAASLGIVCFGLVREGPVRGKLQPEEGMRDRRIAASHVWTTRDAILTTQFLLVSAIMAATMACVTTINSVIVPHLVKLGATPGEAAFVLSAIGVVATIVKGGSGHLCEIMASTMVLAAGVVLQAVGCILLSFADTGVLQYGAALAFGSGWGLSYVAGTLVLIEYFGAETGPRILSVVWLLVTVAAAGPIAAGMIADHTGSFALIFEIFAAMLLLLAVPALLMREPSHGGRVSTVVG
jgi:MFS family permease